jgi:hypothetical protein
MWIALFFACGGKTPVAEVPRAPASATVVRVAELTVGEPVVVCARQAPIFQAGSYTCGPETLAAVEHSVGPTITGEQLWSAAPRAGLDPARPMKIMSVAVGADPDTDVGSGMQLEEPDGVADLFGNYVFELSDGRTAVFLSQNTP